jgi:DNA polymerase III delta subunit
MKASWTKPPAIVYVGGTETFLRDREIRKAQSAAHSTKRRVVKVESDSEVLDELNIVRTFGEPVLIIYDRSGKNPDSNTLKEVLGSGACLLVVLNGDGADISEDQNSAKIIFTQGTSRKDRREAAIRFVTSEAKSLGTPLFEARLAEALVEAVGDDLGNLAFELSKASALARYKSLVHISLEHIKSTLRPSAGVDLSPLVESLAHRDTVGVLKALLRIKAGSVDDPSMMLLRAKSGPAESSLTWIKLAHLLNQGLSEEEAIQRIGVPSWLARKAALPAARKWGLQRLQRLAQRLSSVDRGVLTGTVPDPWIACETALISSCLEE